MASTIITVHTDETLLAITRDALTAAGHSVHEAQDLASALRWSHMASPDLLLMPWAGLEPLRDALGQLAMHRDTGCQCRSIVWAPRERLPEAVTALALGADDCLGIPFEAAELLARVSACLRRPPAGLLSERLSAGPLVLDRAAHWVAAGGNAIELAPTEFRLLAFLLANQGRVFSRDELLRRAWPRHVKAERRTVDVHVRRLRRALEPYGCDAMLQTVRGFGYRFAATAGAEPVKRHADRAVCARPL